MKTTIKIFLLLSLMSTTWSVVVFHRGVAPIPDGLDLSIGSSKWIPKEELGIHQIILSGGPYKRGYEFGRLTQTLLQKQEDDLIQRFNNFFNSPILRTLFVVGSLRWFWGIEEYFEPWMLKEMYGVSQFAPKEYDYLIDSYSRQLAYHGLHEVGQMMIDGQSEDLQGCTAFGIPVENSWIVGRNFDFEAGSVFDEDKLMKWVFPKEGYAFVSVIWAGMVGVVTGVNEHGVYVSLNAAGSDDFTRHGTPTTLILLKALQFSKNADEAKDIIESEKSFITDIFLVADPKNQTVYRIEKSPKKFETQRMEKPFVISNHLQGDIWASDKNNKRRKERLTTQARYSRGLDLLTSAQATPLATSKEASKLILKFLRDKGKKLHLGNRKAIDALLATHSVIYDGFKQTLYVSKGPSLVQEFIGFDLKGSFEKRQPVLVDTLEKDPRVKLEDYRALQLARQNFVRVKNLIDGQQCQEAFELLKTNPTEHYKYYFYLGDSQKCLGLKDDAQKAWAKALALSPAYSYEQKALRDRVKQ